MGRPLEKDNPGLKRIRRLLEELSAPPPGGPAEQPMLAMPSSNGMDKYEGSVQGGKTLDFVRTFTQEEIEREKKSMERCNRKFVEAATRRIDREQDLARERREARENALDEARRLKY